MGKGNAAMAIPCPRPVPSHITGAGDVGLRSLRKRPRNRRYVASFAQRTPVIRSLNDGG